MNKSLSTLPISMIKPGNRFAEFRSTYGSEFPQKIASGRYTSGDLEKVGLNLNPLKPHNTTGGKYNIIFGISSSHSGLR